MDFIQCAKTRRSIRKFTAQPIEVSVIEEIVEIASYSPSWKHSQIARYTFIQNREMVDKIAEEMVLGFTPNTGTIKNAPALVIVSYLKGRSGYERDGSVSTPKGDGFEMYDAGVASQTFCLAAHEKGLGTVICGYFDEEKIAEYIGLDENQSIAAIIPIGYPEAPVEARARKSVSELLRVIE